VTQFTKGKELIVNAIFPVSHPRELAPIVTEIDRQLRGRLRQFKITCDERGLALFGEAPSFYVKQLAQHAVGRMTPLPIVRNEIEVI
jgi:hypothetical protein